MATLLAGLCLWLAGAAGAAPRTGIFGLTAARDFEAAVAEASAAGFELAVVNASRDALDVLQAHGMQGLVALWLRRDVLQNDETWREYLDGVRATVSDLAGHPAIHAWYVADEPDGERISPRKVKELADAIRAVDPRTPLFAVFNTPSSWGAYLPLVDIVAPDPYLRRVPFSGYARPGIVAEWLNRLDCGLRRQHLDKEVWVVLGAFTLRPKDGSEPRYRVPTPDEFRAMAQMARDAGVSGILVYSYAIAESDDMRRWDLPLDDPALWDAVRALPGSQ